MRHLTLWKERFLKVFLVINSRLNNLTENGNKQTKKKKEKRIKRVSRLNCSFFFSFIFFSFLFFFLSKFLEFKVSTQFLQKSLNNNGQCSVMKFAWLPHNSAGEFCVWPWSKAVSQSRPKTAFLGFQVTSQKSKPKITRTFEVLSPSSKRPLKNKLLCKFSTWSRFPFWNSSSF